MRLRHELHSDFISCSGRPTATRTRHRWEIIALLLLLAASGRWRPGMAHAQEIRVTKADSVHSAGTTVTGICDAGGAASGAGDALRLVCLRKSALAPNSELRKAIVVGFVGGFVKRDDAMHPEVQFAAYLRDRYSSSVHAQVFGNHEGKGALDWVVHLLDTDGDGILTDEEKAEGNVIIYGHSWGASQTITLARALGRQNIPVTLTMQVDSVRKPGQDDSTIPSNVAAAVNFYQSGGLIHGRTTIRAADPERTDILGNFHMTYKGEQINCSNNRRLARLFNKPHLEIENDPRIWDQLALLIDLELSTRPPAKPPASALLLKELNRIVNDGAGASLKTE